MAKVNLYQFWDLVHTVIQEVWAITEPHIEEAAVRQNVPVELYYYAELGLDYFSVSEFQQRDPFSNPEQFEKNFAQLEVKGWIVPAREGGRYRTSENVRKSVRQIVQAGDDQLLKFTPAAELDLNRLLQYLKQIVLSNNAAPEPPEKWAIVRRFRTATRTSPVLVQIRECLMDLYAYRDDAHLSAARPYFADAGIVWNAFGAVCGGNAVTAEKIAESMPFRGYEDGAYAAALKAAEEAGWVEETETPGVYGPTPKGLEMRERVENLTNHYFYRPWEILAEDKLEEFYHQLELLREQLHHFAKVQPATALHPAA